MEPRSQEETSGDTKIYCGVLCNLSTFSKIIQEVAMNEVTNLTLAILVLGIAVSALFVAVRTLFGQQAEQIRSAAEAFPGKCVLIGLLNLLFLGALGLALGSLSGGAIPLLSLLAILVFAVLGIAATFGLTGMVLLVGGILKPDQSWLTRVIWGSATLTLGCLVPYVGWFALLPYLVVRGLGAVVLTLWGRRLEGRSAVGGSATA